MWIMASAELNKGVTSIFAINVLPVPDGPVNKNDAISLFLFESPLLGNWIVFTTALTATWLREDCHQPNLWHCWRSTDWSFHDYPCWSLRGLQQDAWDRLEEIHRLEVSNNMVWGAQSLSTLECPFMKFWATSIMVPTASIKSLVKRDMEFWASWLCLWESEGFIIYQGPHLPWKALETPRNLKQDLLHSRHFGNGLWWLAWGHVQHVWLLQTHPQSQGWLWHVEQLLMLQ